MPIEAIEDQKTGRGKRRGKRKPKDEAEPIGPEGQEADAGENDGDEGGEDEAGEQLQLLDVSHPAAAKVASAARRYRKIMRERVALSADEKKEKQKVREILQELVRDGALTADAEGVIIFKVGKLKVKCTPRDELIRVSENGDEDE